MALDIEQQLPLAPPSQVGQWVERHGGAELAERARRIAQVEGTDPSAAAPAAAASPAPKAPDPAAIATAPGGRMMPDEPLPEATRPSLRPPPHDGAFTQTSLVSSDLERPARRSRRATALGLAFALVLLVAVGGLAMRARAPLPPAGAASAVPSAVASLPPSPSVAPSVPMASAGAPDDAVDPSDLPLVAPPSRTARPAPPVRRPPTVDCDPPYTVDANGYRKYKRECATR
jgi:serine/threonine-protein kinase